MEGPDYDTTVGLPQNKGAVQMALIEPDHLHSPELVRENIPLGVDQ